MEVEVEVEVEEKEVVSNVENDKDGSNKRQSDEEMWGDERKKMKNT
jgi:hypothetical protein